MGGVFMAKTIQVRVDDELKESADMLFSSLGLDTSTAIRMFLVAAMESGGIPFAITRRADRDGSIFEAIQRRKAGVEFLTAEQSLANMRSAIKAGVENAF
jgi:DNA-damage-inducible protein J